MIGTSAILQEEYLDHYLSPQPKLLRKEVKAEVVRLGNLELLVVDSETGRPIAKAMVSVDAEGRTAVCDVQGKVVLQDVATGNLTVDVIVYGYSAQSTMIYLSSVKPTSLTVKMVRNC